MHNIWVQEDGLVDQLAINLSPIPWTHMVEHVSVHYKKTINEWINVIILSPQ